MSVDDVTVADDVMVGEALSRDVSDTRANAWWGLLGLCISLAAILTSFVVAYFYLYAAAGVANWPPLQIERPEAGLATIATAVLLASGLPAFWAERNVRRWRPGWVKLGLAVTFVLGVAFLVLLVAEYVRQPFDLATNAYASAFLVLLAFQGVQVAVGLLMAAAVQLWLWLGYYTERRNLAPRNVVHFWYYLIAAWLVVFAVLYLSPAWLR